MRKTLLLSFLTLFALQLAYGETLATPRPEPRQKRSKLWKISAAVVAAATAVDAHSSWGRMEANPLLANGQGRFGSQAVSFKAVVLGGTVGAQYFLLKKRPSAEKYGTLTNFIMAGVLSSAAASNYARHSGSSIAIPTR